MRYLGLLIFSFILSPVFAVEAPTPSADGTRLVWSQVAASNINIQSVEAGYIETIPGSSTEWQASSPGTYYLVATTNGHWSEWQRSPNQVILNEEAFNPGPENPDPDSPTLPLVVSVNTGGLNWIPPGYAHRINVHAGNNDYLTTLPDNARTWRPSSDGSYYLVASTADHWSTWERSNTVTWVASGGTDPVPETAPTGITLTVVDGVLQWGDVGNARSINIHGSGGAYVTTISASRSEWRPSIDGEYYIVATNAGPWTSWLTSNTVTVVTDDSAEPPVINADLQTIHQVAGSTLSDLAGTGYSIAVRIDDQSIVIDHDGDVGTAELPMALASLSKPVTAFILQNMADDGLISLSDAISQHVPELATIPGSDRILNKTVFSFMTHNAGLAQTASYSWPDWRSRLTWVLSQPVANPYSYANDNYTLLTRVVMNVLGSYQAGIDRYINVGGIRSFRIGNYHGIPSYAGVGELEATASDYLMFAERSAPRSQLQSGVYGISWFHNRAGFLDHLGTHDLIGRSSHAMVVWKANAASNRSISFVFLANAVDTNGLIVARMLSAL